MRHLKRYNEEIDKSVHSDIDVIESFLEGLEDIGFTSKTAVFLNVPGVANQEKFQNIYDAKKFMDQNPTKIGSISYNISFNNLGIIYNGSKVPKKTRKGEPDDYSNMKVVLKSFREKISEFTNCVINNISINNDTKYREGGTYRSRSIHEIIEISGGMNLSNSAKKRVNEVPKAI